MYYELMTHLRGQFNEFCGLISLDEIASNDALMRVIERFDRILKAASE